MTDKELRRLSRMELIQLLLEQARELAHVRQELEETKKALEERRIQIHNAGSIAEAAIQINQVLEAAQKAADQYQENVRRESELRTKQQCEELRVRLKKLEDDTKAKCARMLMETRRKAKDHDAD